MMKRIMISIVIGMLLAGSAGAAVLVDTQHGDLMTIDSVSYDAVEEITFVDETYADNDLIPYPSHDGYAVVHDFGSGYWQYFDKYVYLSEIDRLNNFVDLVFSIGNRSELFWSDYHFEFWDLSFQNRLTVNELFFDNEWFNMGETISYTDTYGTGTIVTFWTEEMGNLLGPGMDSRFYLSIDLLLNVDLMNGFALRQVATATPIPGAVWLLGSGLLGLIGFRRKRKS